MATIQVPKPPKSAWTPDRPVSTLLKSQVEHLSEAESKLPHQYKSQIYINAIKTEGEAAEYIQKVTEAIHRAHEAAAYRHAKAAPKRRGAIAISAVAGVPKSAKSAPKPKAKKTQAKPKPQTKKSKSAAAASGRKK